MSISTDAAVIVHRDVRIPTGERDVTLSGDLFLPDGAGPVPLLLTVLPYRRDLAALTGSVLQRWFAARGYAALLVDLRGTGSSDGAPRPPFDPAEADDALAAIRWATRQSWCDGTIGMWGGSYGAITTMRTAARRPAELRAIIVLQGMLDPEGDFVHPGQSRGALAPLGIWSMDTLLGQLLPPVDDYADPAEQRRWRERLAATPYLLDLWRHPPGDPDWARRRIDASAIEVPALCLAGWRDLFVDGTIRAYERMSGPKRLVAGPWLHVLPQESPVDPVDFPNLALSWWDRWLRDAPDDTEAAPPVGVRVQGNRPRWLGFTAWPPGADSPADLSTWLRTQPSTPDPSVGALSGLWSVPAALFGLPLDQHDDDAGSLCYTSPPLTEPLLLSGRPRVTATGSWPRVSIKLCDVDEAGRSTLICAGLGSIVDGTVEIALTPTTYELPAGHRLRIAIASGDFPRVWPESPPGNEWPSATHLSLPVVTADQAEEIDYPRPVPDGSPAAGVPEPEPPVWEIRRNLVDDTVSVRLAMRITGDGTQIPNTHNRNHVVRVERELIATAHRGEPHASTITATMAAAIDTETGARITVDIGLSASSSEVDATGRVTVDGETILDRRWRG